MSSALLGAENSVPLPDPIKVQSCSPALPGMVSPEGRIPKAGGTASLGEYLQVILKYGVLYSWYCLSEGGFDGTQTTIVNTKSSAGCSSVRGGTGITTFSRRWLSKAAHSRRQSWATFPLAISSAGKGIQKRKSLDFLDGF